ncbi:MAG: TIGR01440 family protein [Peptococcaceae bacterium]|nr:TIGR01440 family protein [Peptococcaceae bacterium]MDH7526196.1 TIGR01440 family protein [Peptococcaceae bacterium]
MDDLDLERITAKVRRAIEDLLAAARLNGEDILVVGCSTSEIVGKKIGTASSLEVAAAVMNGLYPVCRERGLFLAVQCCEHLNRALVVEKRCLEKYSLEEVTVFPVQGAGGSLAYLAMKKFEHPVVVENIRAHAGLDIGDTFIGMHLKPVVVPVRGSLQTVGMAHLTMARTRPKLIGGERARYQPC